MALPQSHLCADGLGPMEGWLPRVTRVCVGNGSQQPYNEIDHQ
jgi:hypothetical protein